MYFRSPRPTFPRRGVTLVEMLVTVALLVLMMTVIVQIFTAATGAVSASRTYQELDSSLRQLDSTVRQDLGNVTAKMTPPLNPKDNLGYFEYIENSFADLQGEDTDDCLRFTVKAPEGQIFTGRFVPTVVAQKLATGLLAVGLPMSQALYDSVKHATPITIQSEFAEVIYFLRNGNLYRRVLLVAPDNQTTMVNIGTTGLVPNSLDMVSGTFSTNPGPITSNPQAAVSWLGSNDLSARPSPLAGIGIVLNTLGSLTNRENRYAAPRFVNDYPLAAQGAGQLPGQPDDYNGDSVPDFWPSLYFNMATNGLIRELIPTTQTTSRIQLPNGNANATFQTMAFPYIYPYAYSQPEQNSFNNGLGWIHSPDPSNAANTITKLLALNHGPLDIGVGDSLARPGSNQTWWGFPTWRETMSPSWWDPLIHPGTGPFGNAAQQAFGLNPFPANTTMASLGTNYKELLPPMTTNLVGSASTPALSQTGVIASYRNTTQLFNDAFGSDAFAAYPPPALPSPLPASVLPTAPVDMLWRQLWEDDLLMSGVRSFDVKAYDNSFPGYVDLGWGDDGRLVIPYVGATAAWTPPLLGARNASTSSSPFVYGFGGAGTLFTWPPGTGVTYYPFFPSGASLITPAGLLYNSTFAHEGRIPPLAFDARSDAQAPQFGISDESTQVVRLRRVWDSWSTDYTNAPATGVVPVNPPVVTPIPWVPGTPYGLAVGGAPIYPSYPPPYPMPLRGIQIQIRVVDPRNERVKVLTIRQDFSDKL